MKTFDVLVTDSRYKHSLSIVRFLGRSGLKVATCSNKFSPTKYSKYSKGGFRYNDSNFEGRLISFLKKNDVKLIIPVGYQSNIKCSKIKNKIKKYSNVIIGDYEKLSYASNKDKTTEILKKYKMPFPKTFFVEKESDIKKISGSKFAIKSCVEESGEKVEYASSKEELLLILKRRLELGKQSVQEYIEGEGRGFFAFCNNGKVIQSFQHRRVRQYPESGGVSSCAESIKDEKLEKLSNDFLKKIKWTGPVMLEYIYNKKTKSYYFIEMNGKFWGSYDLSVFCGINFAKIPYDIVNNNKMSLVKYSSGKRFQWLLPEDLLRIKTSKDKNTARKDMVSDFKNKDVSNDIQYIFNDPLPTIIRIFSTIWKYIFGR